MSILNEDRRIIVKNPTILGLVNEVKWYKSLGYFQSSKITRQLKKDGGNYMVMMTKQEAFYHA